jgi:hypothetical protein
MMVKIITATLMIMISVVAAIMTISSYAIVTHFKLVS